MGKFLVAAVLLSLINHGADLATAWDDKDFFSYCPPTNCSKHGPEIRFPFRLKSSNTSSACGASCMELACFGQDTILVHPVLGRCKVTAIDYSLPTFKIIPLVDSPSPCPLLQKLISRSIPVDVAFAEPQGHCDLCLQSYATLVCCSKEFAPSIDDADSIAGPISCLGNATHFLYLVDASEPISILPSDCKVCSDGVVPIPMNYNRPFPLKSIISFAEITLRWYETDSDSASKARLWCPFCEQQGRHCAFSSQRNQTFCMPHGIASK